MRCFFNGPQCSISIQTTRDGEKRRQIVGILTVAVVVVCRAPSTAAYIEVFTKIQYII